MSKQVLADSKRSDNIIEWLADHPLISRNALCKIVGYDVSSLLKCEKKERVIPEKHLAAFERELSRYGFTK